MTPGLIIYADSLSDLRKRLVGIPEETAIAVFSCAEYEMPEQVIFSRFRSQRNPAAELAAARAHFPGVSWTHSKPLEAPDVTRRLQPGQGLPPVAQTHPVGRAPLRVQGIACACGGKAAAEAKLMLQTFKHFHPEIPAFLLTDPAGAELLAEFEGMSGVVIQVLDESEQRQLCEKASGAARPHGDYWPITWVAAKLEALTRAKSVLGGAILLCDADLIFSRRLPELSWDADLVLSEHAGPLPDRLPDRSGIYNAGLLLVRSGAVVRRWREMFFSGVGGFYEQGCLEQLAREYVTDTFPAAWNWGDWRRTENLIQSGRVPPILHTHLDEGAHRIPNRLEARKSIEHVAHKVLRDVRAALAAPKKIGFMHYPKAAGASFARMWGWEVCPRGGWQEVNSFSWLGRAGDWKPEEFALIRSGNMAGLRGDRFFVHAHSQNWPDDEVRAFREDGWEFCALYRDMRERLVSLWHWNKKRGAIKGPASKAETLEEFVRTFLSEECYSRELALHPAHECVEHWAPATSDGMVSLTEKITGLKAAPLKVNRSRSRGYRAAVESGEISEKLAQLIESDARVQSWDTFADDRGLS